MLQMMDVVIAKTERSTKNAYINHLEGRIIFQLKNHTLVTILSFWFILLPHLLVYLIKKSL